MSEPVQYCANGDGRPVSPPSTVPLGWPADLCGECLEALAAELAAEAKHAAKGE